MPHLYHMVHVRRLLLDFACNVMTRYRHSSPRLIGCSGWLPQPQKVENCLSNGNEWGVLKRTLQICFLLISRKLKKRRKLYNNNHFVFLMEFRELHSTENTTKAASYFYLWHGFRKSCHTHSPIGMLTVYEI